MKCGFTLIELLVVVLIIGILSAVALPQYQKAVWKTRASSMLPNLRALGNAQELYYMENGQYATRYDQLGLSFDSLPKKPATSLTARSIVSTDAVRQNDMYEITLNISTDTFVFSTAMFITGPYFETGLVIPHQTGLPQLKNGEIYCIEARTVSAYGKFCKQFYGAELVVTGYGVSFYRIP